VSGGGPEAGTSDEAGPRRVALDSHPSVLGSIARLRSRGALCSAAFVALLSYTAGVPLDDCIMRGLIAGIVGYFVGWYVGVTVWRQLLRAQLRIAIAKREAETAEAES
jgi:hypothetical protein